MSTNFPVFGAGGLEGDLSGASTSGTTGTPLPTMEYRDKAKEAEAAEANWHRVSMMHNPQLARAQAARERAEAEVHKWGQVCVEQQSEVTRLQTLVQRSRGSLQYEDVESSSRAARLKAALVLLEESRQELAAAHEELQAAVSRVHSLMQVSA